MSKQLLLNFNQDGSLSQSQSTGSAIRQGDSNGEVTLVATFQNRRNDSYVAKLHFERPDGKKQRNIVMTPSASQLNQFDYSFLSGWFFAVAGTAKVTVTITDSNGAVSAQGSYSFAVEPTQVDVVDSTITYDEAAELEGLIANSIKRAKTVTLGQNVGVAGFYAACLSYLGDSAILDGDRFVGTTTNQSLNQSTNFFGEFVGDDKMLVLAKKRTYPTPASLIISHSVYVVSGGAQNPIVTEMVDIEKLSSLFDGTAAKKAISDQNGHVIDWTYATKAEVVAANNVGYIKIDDENDDENGNLTAAQVAEANKDICFIQYTNSEGTMMLVSYYFGGTERYFWSFMTNTSETGEPDGSPWAYRFRQARIILWDINDPTSATWQFNEDDDVHVTHEPEQTSSDLITSHGVYKAVSALDSKISKNAEDIAALTEALIKKDLYETQEATFQGMTAVPAGAMVKAYLDGFKGNSIVINEKLDHVTVSSSGNRGLTLSYKDNTPTNRTIVINGTYDESISGAVDINGEYLRLDTTHYYLFVIQTKNVPSGFKIFNYGVTATRHSSSYIAKPDTTGVTTWQVESTNGDVYNNAEVTISLIDLTQWYGAGFEPTSMDDVKTKMILARGFLAKNAGTLTDSKPTKLYSRNAILKNLSLKSITTIALNTLGFYTIGTNRWQASLAAQGAKKNSASSEMPNIYCSKYTALSPNDWEGAGDKTMTLTIDGFLRIRDSSITQASDFSGTLFYQLATPSSTISQAVIDGLVEHEYDLTMPALKSAGSVQDESKAWGMKVGKDDLGDETWSYQTPSGGQAHFATTSLASRIKKPANNKYSAPWLLTPKGYAITNISNLIYIDKPDKSMAVDTNGQFVIADSAYDNATSFDTAMTGVPINYALATPTDFSDPISYPEIFDVYAGGSIEIVGDGCDATTKVYFYVEA